MDSGHRISACENDKGRKLVVPGATSLVNLRCSRRVTFLLKQSIAGSAEIYGLNATQCPINLTKEVQRRRPQRSMNRA